MQLNLNTKEWMTLLVHLERVTAPASSKFDIEEGQIIDRIRGRMRQVIEKALKDQEINLGSQWLARQKERVDVLERANKDTNKEFSTILTADDDDDTVGLRPNYPKRPPKIPRAGRKGRKRR
jgi:hypothetical protein